MLREQGLGRHVDEDFIAAAMVEMREAMNMSAGEFEAAADQLLRAEREGHFRLDGCAGCGWRFYGSGYDPREEKRALIQWAR